MSRSALGVVLGLGVFGCGFRGPTAAQTQSDAADPDARGGDARVELDASALDAAPDGNGDPPPSSVALTVTSVGVPVAGVVVYFQDLSSSLVFATKTDAQGIAFAQLDDGGYVTALGPIDSTGAMELTTFAAVAKADRLRLDLQPTNLAPLVAVTVNVPAVAGATGYELYNSCGDVLVMSGATGEVSFNDCGSGLIDLVIVPHDDQGDHPFGALFAPGVVIAAGGNLLVTGTYASFQSLPYTYRNLVPEISWLGTYRAVLTPRGRVYDVSSGDVPAMVVTDSVLIPPVLPTTSILTVTDEVPVSAQLGEQLIYDWRSFGAPYDLDVGANRIRAFSATPSYSAAAHTLTWSEQSANLDANVVRAHLHTVRVDVAWSWQIAATKTGTSVTFPVLPIDVFDFNPSSTDTVTADLTTALVPGGYAAMRAHAFAEFATTITGPSGLMIVQVPFSPQL